LIVDTAAGAALALVQGLQNTLLAPGNTDQLDVDFIALLPHAHLHDRLPPLAVLNQSYGLTREKLSR
jgi:hypothetical protein